MSTDSKKMIEDWATWITRGAVVIILTMLVRMQENVNDLVSEKKVLTSRLNTVEANMASMRADLNDIFKNYDLKPKR